jgi:hypothetical protein
VTETCGPYAHLPLNHKRPANRIPFLSRRQRLAAHGPVCEFGNAGFAEVPAADDALHK